MTEHLPSMGKTLSSIPITVKEEEEEETEKKEKKKMTRRKLCASMVLEATPSL